MPADAELPMRLSPEARRSAAGIVLAILLLGSFFLKLNHLNHQGIKPLDEAFHAVVARHLIAHPLTPTLFDPAWLPYDYRQWQSNHIWLHKPILPLWTMAASMSVFGVSTLAMRLPSAILATLAIWLTYLIAEELLGDWRAALIAATLQAFNPPITSLVQGYLFSDHVDVALLFWVELAVYLLVRAIRTGSIGWAIAAGIAQGLAYLSKTYPAFIVTGIALVAWLAPLSGFGQPLARDARRRFASRHVLILLAATLLTALPWTIWCFIHFRNEFLFEQVFVFRHLTSDIENWAAPWDRLVFDFSLRIYGLLYPASIVAAILMIVTAWRRRSLGLWLLLAWAFGVLLPNIAAISKTPTSTLIGWPPFFILLGAMIARGIDGDPACMSGWLSAVLLAVFAHGTIPREGFGYPPGYFFGQIMRQHIWVLWQVLISLVVALAAAMISARLLAPRRGSAVRGRGRSAFRIILASIAGLATLWIAAQWGLVCWKVTEFNRTQPTFKVLGAQVNAQLPANAVLLLEIHEKLEHIVAMFWIDRTVYPVTPATIEVTASRIRAAGGVPYLVTRRPLPLPMALPQQGPWRVYDLRWAGDRSQRPEDRSR